MRIVAEGLRFPEGPIAMPDGSVLVVEIERQTLSRVSPRGEVTVVAQLAGGPNGAALGPDGRVYVCNNGGFSWLREADGLRPHGASADYRGGWIEAVDLQTGKVERLYERCGAHRLNGPNDLVFDEHGGFWFTDLGKRRARDMDRGFVYWARADGSEIREAIGGMITPNGIGLAPDGKTLYVAETDTGRLWAFDVVGSGELKLQGWPSPAGGRCVASLPGYGRFDSLALAASGNICVATVEGSSIAEFTPGGTLVALHPCDDRLVTNLCFGGPDRRSAFITLSYSGRLVSMSWHEPGLELHFLDRP